MHFSISAHLMRVGGAEVEGDEGEPDDAGGVHREPDELGLVEVLRNLPGLDSVEGADRDQNHAVHLQTMAAVNNGAGNKVHEVFTITEKCLLDS